MVSLWFYYVSKEPYVLHSTDSGHVKTVYLLSTFCNTSDQITREG